MAAHFHAGTIVYMHSKKHAHCSEPADPRLPMHMSLRPLTVLNLLTLHPAMCSRGHQQQTGEGLQTLASTSSGGTYFAQPADLNVPSKPGVGKLILMEAQIQG